MHAPLPSADGVFYLSPGTSEGSISALVPVPLQQQAQQLADMGDYGAALELSNQLPQGAGAEGGSAGSKQQLQDKLRTQYAYHLFAGEACGRRGRRWRMRSSHQ